MKKNHSDKAHYSPWCMLWECLVYLQVCSCVIHTPFYTTQNGKGLCVTRGIQDLSESLFFVQVVCGTHIIYEERIPVWFSFTAVRAPRREGWCKTSTSTTPRAIPQKSFSPLHCNDLGVWWCVWCEISADIRITQVSNARHLAQNICFIRETRVFCFFPRRGDNCQTRNMPDDGAAVADPHTSHDRSCHRPATYKMAPRAGGLRVFSPLSHLMCVVFLSRCVWFDVMMVMCVCGVRESRVQSFMCTSEFMSYNITAHHHIKNTQSTVMQTIVQFLILSQIKNTSFSVSLSFCGCCHWLLAKHLLSLVDWSVISNFDQSKDSHTNTITSLTLGEKNMAGICLGIIFGIFLCQFSTRHAFLLWMSSNVFAPFFYFPMLGPWLIQRLWQIAKKAWAKIFLFHGENASHIAAAM